MFQWLRVCASTAGGMGSIPGQGTKIWHAAQRKKKAYCFQPSLAKALQHLTPGKITPFKIRKENLS